MASVWQFNNFLLLQFDEDPSQGKKYLQKSFLKNHFSSQLWKRIKICILELKIDGF